MKLTIWDITLILLLLALSAFITVNAGQKIEGKKAVIYVDNERFAVLDIGADRTLEVSSKDGNAVIRSDQNGIQIVSSSCPHLHCVKMGRISIAGQVIVCVPNHILIKIEGNGKDSVDGVAG